MSLLNTYLESTKETYSVDAFNAMLEKQVPGFGGGGPFHPDKARAYYKKLIELLEKYSKNEA